MVIPQPAPWRRRSNQSARILSIRGVRGRDEAAERSRVGELRQQREADRR